MSEKRLPIVFFSGLLCGFTFPILAAVVWIGGGISLREHGEVVVEAFPKGINTLTVQNNIVEISTTNLTMHRDVPLELNLTVNCRDQNYGSLYGLPWREKFFFVYENEHDSRSDDLPLNDIHGVHPTTRLKLGEQDVPPKSDRAGG